MSEVENGMETAILDYSSTNKFLPTEIRYGDGSNKQLSWQGKRLTRIIGSTINANFSYDSQYEIDFVYDTNGMLIGLNPTEGQYFYRRDITGNIIGMLDSNGAYVVRYRYDP